MNGESMCENLRTSPYQRRAEFSQEHGFSAKMARRSNIVEESLISGKVSINSLASITKISHYKLNKAKKRLLQGLSMPELESLYPRRPAWTDEQLAYLLDPSNLLEWSTDSLIKRREDHNKKFPFSKISLKRLRKLYKERGIKQRVMRIDIALTPS